MLSVVLILPLGIGLGWLLARRVWPGKLVIEALLALPLVLPPVATGFLLLKFLGKRGPLAPLLHAVDIQIVFTPVAVVIALGVMSLPLLVRSARAAFEGVSPRLEQIARTLGAHPLNVFFTITLPLATRGIVGGLLLAFARALGEFGATVVIAGSIPGKTATLAVSLFNAIQLGKDADALGLLAVAVVLALGTTWLSERLIQRSHQPR
jgi:molybdate transport system permease protein